MTTIIRAAGRTDLTDLTELAARTFPLACPPRLGPTDIARFIDTHLTKERFADHLADPLHGVFVADRDGVLLGYTLGLVQDAPPEPHIAELVHGRPTVELSKCYTAPTAHGSGVAAELMDHTVAWARDEGAASVWLGVNTLNVRARTFYAKHGFVVVGTRRFTVGDAVEDDHVLERNLGEQQDTTC